MPNLVSLSAEQGPQNVDVELILGAASSDSPVFTTKVTMPDGVVMPTVAPTIGQVIAATSPTTAAWQTPAGGGGVTQHKRISFGTIGSALISLPISIFWDTPFADNNYTVLAQAVIGEATSDGAVTSIINVASVELQAGGVGVIVTAANADSIPHSVVVNLYAVHD